MHGGPWQIRLKLNDIEMAFSIVVVYRRWSCWLAHFPVRGQSSGASYLR